jgi:hypothetical protein
LNNGVVSNDGGVACCEDDEGVEIAVENEVLPLLKLLLLQEGLFWGLDDDAVLVAGVEDVEDRAGSAPRLWDGSH